jgi:zinc transporter
MAAELRHTLATYGADQHGLICGYRFADGGREPIDSDAALQPPAAAGEGFVWLHFNLSHAGTLPWLRTHGGLGDDEVEALREGSRSSRIERSGDALFAVINDVAFDFSWEASDVATLWVWVTPRRVLSARRHPLRSVDRLRLAVKQGETLHTPLALLDHLLRDQADELQHIARQATERVDDIEDELLAGKLGTHSAELARLRRLAVRLQRLLAPEPAALLRMLGNPPAWVPAADLQSLRQASEEFAVVLRDIGALQERIKLLQEETAAQVAEQNNRSLYVLTLVTVMALPINLVAGLLGMNVGGVPLSGHAHGFWWVLGLIAAFTLALGAWVARRFRPGRSRR